MLLRTRSLPFTRLWTASRSPVRALASAPFVKAFAASPSRYLSSSAYFASPGTAASQKAMATLSAGLQVKASSAASLDFDALPRTYESALHLLSLLPTNRDVTVLFEVPQDSSGKPFDFNSLAIPEVVAWMARAGYSDLPKDLAPLKCIHVAGTKGKGSVCAFATAILVAASRAEAASSPERGSSSSAVGRVGTYLSPHVVSVRERIWLDGQPIGRDLFAKYTFELWERLSKGAAAADPSDPEPHGPHTKPFYFRFLTLLAFHVFLSEGVRSAVIECGIGGEYDATNILPASSVTATAVTRLGIDHVAMLGRTLEEIAWHKAGIFKEGVAAFTLQGSSAITSDDKGTAGSADQNANATLAILRQRAVEKKTLSLTLFEVSPQAVQDWEGVPGSALTGSFQKYNMALAAAIARHHIKAVGLTGSVQDTDVAELLNPTTIPSSFRKALSKASLRGRCEFVSVPQQDGKRSTEYLVDGAHTADSLSEVARFFAKKTAGISPPPRRILLFSVRDRNPGELVRAVVAGTGQDGFFQDAIFVFPSDATLLIEDARLTMHEVSPTTTIHVGDDTRAAIGLLQTLGAADMPLHVLAAGSFVLAREVLQELNACFEE